MKKALLFIFVVLLIALSIAAYFILNSPGKALTDTQKTQALTNILGRKPNLTDSSPKGNSTFNGKFASFSYPASAVIYKYIDSNLAKDPTILETFSFDMSNPRLIFNFSVSENKNVKSISDIPDVRLRQVQSNIYSQNTAFADGVEGLVFQKQDQNGSIEKTAFFFVNGKSYSFSIQGTDLKGVENLYDLILQSTKFLLP